MLYFSSHYDLWMVAASLAIAGFASYLALDLAKRVRSADRKLARAWWLGGSLAMGTGIWAMHFVGMLAFSIPIALGYTRPLTALSWVAAVAVSAIGLGIASGATLGRRRLAIGATTMGAGIFAMHYIGMAALDMAPGIVWSAPLVAASLAIAVAAAAVALQIFFWLRRAGEQREPAYQIGAAAVMGVAICGMHYTGMAAASFPVGSICLSAGSLADGGLHSLIAVSALGLFGVTLITSFFDARMRRRTELIASSLRDANARLEQERERFRDLTTLSSDWFWEQDPEQRFTDISIAPQGGSGVDRESFLGKTGRELGWAPTDTASMQRYLELIAQRRTFRDFQVQRLEADGLLRFVSNSGAPVHDEAGCFIGWRGVGHDITERIRQDRRNALRAQTTRLLADSSPTGDLLPGFVEAVCVACGWPGGTIRDDDAVAGGAGAQAFWAVPSETETFARLAHSADAASCEAAAAETGLDGTFTCAIRAGARRFAELQFRFRALAGGDPATLEVVRDLALQIGQVLARREAEHGVRQERALLAERVEERTRDLSHANRDLEAAKVGAEAANRAKSAFLATMSHEIRTPMNGVIGMIEILARSALSEDQRDAVRTIRASAFSLLTLIDDILDFSKIEAGRLQIEHAPVSLGDIAEGICDLLAPEAASRGVELRLFVAPDLPERIWSDATRLRQALSNLVSNAVKFSGGRADVAGRVSVRIERDRAQPRRIALRVIDNGIGIGSEKLGHLFAPFTQAEASTTRRYGGTGLGLVICKRVTALLGGDVSVDSVEGVGSTFTITLPFEAAASEASIAAADLGGIDCIVVAAPLLAADDLRAYLEHAGAVVHVVADAQAVAARVADGAGGQNSTIVIERAEAGAGAPAMQRSRLAGGDSVGHVMLVPQGKRTRPELLASGLVAIGEAGLRRASLLRAVALAAGREAGSTELVETAAAPNAQPLEAPTVKEARANRRLILVAEDDAVNQKVILMQLALLGYAAEVAGDGEEALQLWREGGYALLLSDLHMPKLDGYGLAAAIREAEALAPEKPRLPIVALTANAMRDEGGRVRAAGMDEYLTKPVQLTALDKTLAQWLPRASGAVAPAAAASGAPDDAPLRATTNGDEAAIELSVLEDLVGNDATALREFLSEFLAVARQQATELAAACRRGDLGRAASVAHKLKASSRSIGALGLGDLCAELENTSKAGGKADVDRVRIDFERVVAAVDAGIVALLATQPA